MPVVASKNLKEIPAAHDDMKSDIGFGEIKLECTWRKDVLIESFKLYSYDFLPLCQFYHVLYEVFAQLLAYLFVCLFSF